MQEELTYSRCPNCILSLRAYLMSHSNSDGFNSQSCFSLVCATIEPLTWQCYHTADAPLGIFHRLRRSDTIFRTICKTVKRPLPPLFHLPLSFFAAIDPSPMRLALGLLRLAQTIRMLCHPLLIANNVSNALVAFSYLLPTTDITRQQVARSPDTSAEAPTFVFEIVA